MPKAIGLKKKGGWKKAEGLSKTAGFKMAVGLKKLLTWGSSSRPSDGSRSEEKRKLKEGSSP
jgi:hypothetical protein